MHRLAGKVAVITGVGPGIGRSISLAYAREGAKVVLVSRGGDALDRTAADIAAAGGEARVIVGNTAERETWDRIKAAADESFGDVNLVVNSAASAHLGNVLEITEEEWDDTMAVNLKSAFHSFQTFIPKMIENGGGTFVNISSINGIIANPRLVDYATSKAGLNGLTRNMALDFGLQGLRFNVIAPGAIFTDEAEAELDEVEVATTRDGYPVGRWGKPDDIASAAVFLGSDESSFITGQTLRVDGGLTLITPEANTRQSFRARWRAGEVRIINE